MYLYTQTRRSKRLRAEISGTDFILDKPTPQVTLPTEVLALVVSYSNNDTLAKWMRVSSEYNELAAPFLYEYITLDYGEAIDYDTQANRQEVGGKDEQPSEGQGDYD
jgi:hypothetical protein